ncbi:ankyrin repeat-containing domain protein, partial [Infundibulicybe gibba]
MATPTDDECADLLLSCRYGELDEVRQFVEHFGGTHLAGIHDDNHNTILHMVCGNGHLDVLSYILPIIPPTMLSAQNTSLSTPLHWAALNSHLDIMKKLIEYPEGPGVNLIDIKNSAGHSPLADAELAGWDEGAKWLVEMMNLDNVGDSADGSETKDASGDALDVSAAQDIEVEIEDADGQIARMTI